MTGFLQSGIKGTSEAKQVEAIAKALLDHMNEATSQSLLESANAPGKSSSGVQAALLPFLRGLGFADESKGLFANYHTSAVRPDYFLKMGSTGILLEVERGKTTINNMDFLDFWKCHLCEQAHYLFLLVPQVLRQNEVTGRPTKPYTAVVRRLQSFFVPRNYTNVRGLFVFGY